MPQIDLFIFCSLCSSVLVLIFVLLTLLEQKLGGFCSKILKVRTKLFSHYTNISKNLETVKVKKVSTTYSKLLNTY